MLHVAARLDDADRVVELRSAPDASRALLDAWPGDVVQVGDHLAAEGGGGQVAGGHQPPAPDVVDQSGAVRLGGARGDRVRKSLRHLLEIREYICSLGKSVKVRWIKGHVGHHGNELADALARSIARNTLAGTGHDEQVQRLDRIARAWEGGPIGHEGCHEVDLPD